jgi:hypothetical protein
VAVQGHGIGLVRLQIAETWDMEYRKLCKISEHVQFAERIGNSFGGEGGLFRKANSGEWSWRPH